MKLLSYLLATFACLQILSYRPGPASAASIVGPESISSLQVRLLAVDDPGLEATVDGTFGEGTSDIAEERVDMNQDDSYQAADELEVVAREANREASGFDNEPQDSPAEATNNAPGSDSGVSDRTVRASEAVTDAAAQAREKAAEDAERASEAVTDTAAQAQNEVAEDADALQDASEEAGSDLEETASNFVESVKSLFDPNQMESPQ